MPWRASRQAPGDQAERVAFGNAQCDAAAWATEEPPFDRCLDLQSVRDGWPSAEKPNANLLLTKEILLNFETRNQDILLRHDAHYCDQNGMQADLDSHPL